MDGIKDIINSQNSSYSVWGDSKTLNWWNKILALGINVWLQRQVIRRGRVQMPPSATQKQEPGMDSGDNGIELFNCDILQNDIL